MAAPARLPVLVAVVAVVALNLRPGVTTVGPELDTITAHFGAGSVAGGIITALPVIAFALVSTAAPLLFARISVRTGLCGALTLIGLSLALRPWGDLAGFVAGTFLAALGIGLLAVLLPVVVRSVGSTSALVTTFTTALQAGAAIGFAAVVPLSRAVGGWQWGSALWAILAPIAILAVRAVPALAASPSAVSPVSPSAGSPAVPPSATSSAGSPAVPPSATSSAGSPAVSPSAASPAATSPTSVRPIAILRRTGTVGLALFFGLQALVAFVVIGWLPSILEDAGVSAQAAGGYLGILTFLGVPISLIVPPLVARSAHPSRWLGGFSACTVLGVLAFLVAPGAAPLLWSLILGVGLSVFSLALTVVTLRASAENALGVSGAVQGVGYLLAAIGPYAIGLFRDLSSGWTLPLAVLLVTAVAQLILGFAVGDPAPSVQRKA
ncbi:MFS transporter [Nocardia pseudobrasiliensis]|uniref:CP family cyanate transporter-like MFS transporter n=1 Tax=Nocardia pseudobrasiliensis TaxID=45979 RepID=A0A370IA61_9NOCA|nr:MFS transporter [Nocardia pseudobrasiliensis]RDI67578.1 CP family cyanate transporter-like MFS transporter [Nocardia pseudobrasiliensis]